MQRYFKKPKKQIFFKNFNYLLLIILIPPSQFFSIHSPSMIYRNGLDLSTIDTLQNLSKRNIVFPTNLSSGNWSGSYLDLDLGKCEFYLEIHINEFEVSGDYSLKFRVDAPDVGMTWTDKGLINGNLVGDSVKLILISTLIKHQDLKLNGSCLSIGHLLPRQTDGKWISDTIFSPIFMGTIKDMDQKQFTQGTFMVWKD